jgi:hypothetical protein
MALAVRKAQGVNPETVVEEVKRIRAELVRLDDPRVYHLSRKAFVHFALAIARWTQSEADKRLRELIEDRAAYPETWRWLTGNSGMKQAIRDGSISRPLEAARIRVHPDAAAELAPLGITNAQAQALSILALATDAPEIFTGTAESWPDIEAQRVALQERERQLVQPLREEVARRRAAWEEAAEALRKIDG